MEMLFLVEETPLHCKKQYCVVCDALPCWLFEECVNGKGLPVGMMIIDEGERIIVRKTCLCCGFIISF